VVQRFGGRLHLMVEIKDEPWPDPAGRNRRLARIFEGLRPREDYHLLALDPRLFGRIRFAPASCFVAVAQGLPAAASRIALAAGFAGIAAHYLLLSDRRLSRHHAAGQSAGTGYARSLPVLFREVGRGVDWVFTNHAGALLGALTAGWVGKVRHQGRAVVWAVAVWGVGITAFGLVGENLWLGLAFLALAGAADVISAVFRGTILQLTVPDVLRGRLSAINILVVTGGPRLGDLEAGLVAAAFTPQVSVVSGGILCVVGAFALARLVPAFWRYHAGEPA